MIYKCCYRSLLNGNINITAKAVHINNIVDIFSVCAPHLTPYNVGSIVSIGPTTNKKKIIITFHIVLVYMIRT